MRRRHRRSAGSRNTGIEETYFQYEHIADNGYRHVFIVGGAPDNLGWGECIWDDTGRYFASSRVIPSSFDTVEHPIWMELADDDLEVYWPR